MAGQDPQQTELNGMNQSQNMRAGDQAQSKPTSPDTGQLLLSLLSGANGGGAMQSGMTGASASAPDGSQNSNLDAIMAKDHAGKGGGVLWKLIGAIA